MRQPFLALFISLFVFCAAGTAAAQTSRLYFAGYMGLNTPLEQEFGESTTTLSGDVEADNTLSFAGALGLRLDKSWRIEAEVSYRSADLDRIDIGPGGTSKISGSMGTTLYMANLYYDFDFEWRNLFPFLTAGAGLAWHSTDVEAAPALLPDASDSTIGFAWQLGSGLKYRLSENAALTTSYRYIGTTDLEVDTYDFDYGSHEIRLGLEYDIPPDLFK